MRLAHYLIVESNSNDRIPNAKFLSALTARGIDTLKVFASGRDVSNAQETINPTINYPRRKKSKDIKCILCESNHPSNYKGCMVHKDLLGIPSQHYEEK